MPSLLAQQEQQRQQQPLQQQPPAGNEIDDLIADIRRRYSIASRRQTEAFSNEQLEHAWLPLVNSQELDESASLDDHQLLTMMLMNGGNRGDSQYSASSSGSGGGGGN